LTDITAFIIIIINLVISSSEFMRMTKMSSVNPEEQNLKSDIVEDIVDPRVRSGARNAEESDAEINADHNNMGNRDTGDKNAEDNGAGDREDHKNLKLPEVQDDGGNRKEKEHGEENEHREVENEHREVENEHREVESPENRDQGEKMEIKKNNIIHADANIIDADEQKNSKNINADSIDGIDDINGIDGKSGSQTPDGPGTLNHPRRQRWQRDLPAPPVNDPATPNPDESTLSQQPSNWWPSELGNYSSYAESSSLGYTMNQTWNSKIQQLRRNLKLLPRLQRESNVE
jgi:hypothetical protein